MIRCALLMMTLLAAVACESAEAKAERLRNELAVASLLLAPEARNLDAAQMSCSVVERDSATVTPERRKYVCAVRDSVLEEYVKAKNRFDVAEREMNTFMGGR